MRRSLTQFVFAAAMLLPLPALAQNQNCPNGAWFCEQVEVQIPPIPVPVVRPAQPPQVVVEEPPAPPAPPAPPPRHRNEPPVVVYQPAPANQTRVIIVTPGYGSGYYQPAQPSYYPPAQPVSRQLVPPPKPKPVWRSEFGLNMRVEGAYVGHPENTDYNTGLGGIGMSLRYRPVPAFAFDLGVDVLAGTDYNGFHRTEVPFSLSGLIYLNPRSHAQFYFLAGLDYARATVKSDVRAQQLTADAEDLGSFSTKYSYFGGHGGLGLEFRLSKRVAINMDGVAFVRKRVDDNSNIPEFVDPSTGRTTNTSGGGLFRGGLTLWW